MKRVYLLLAMLALSSNAVAWQISCDSSGKAKDCYSWFIDKNRATGKEKRSKISFKITDGAVDTSSVCSNHKYGSIDAIKCKREASILFRKACRADEDDNSLSYARKRLYCDAYRNFVPSR
jgi:hypothetical protein